MDSVPDSLAISAATSSQIWRIVIILACVILSAFFAACETALAKCNIYKIESLALDDNKKAKVLLKILNNFDQANINNLIWINILHIIATTVATILFVLLIVNSDALASVISTAVMTIIIFLFSEMIPKNVANHQPNRFALSASIPLYISIIIFFPTSYIFFLLVKLTRLIFKIDNKENEITEDDFQETVDDIASLGDLEEEESEIIQNAVEFSDFTVMDVLTKLNDLVAIDINNLSKKKLIKQLLETNYTRIPIYDGSIQNIIGVLHVKKYLLKVRNSSSYINIKRVLSKALFVDQNKTLDEMVEIFQENKNHMAFVKNSKGKVIGMVTMEDVIEKLVGDINETTPPKANLEVDL